MGVGSVGSPWLSDQSWWLWKGGNPGYRYWTQGKVKEVAYALP